MKLKGFCLHDCESLLKRSIIEYECDDTTCSIWGALFRLFSIDEYSIVFLKGRPNTKVVCFQSYYTRKTYIEQMDTFANTYKCDLFRLVKSNSRRITGIVHFFKFIVPWLYSLHFYYEPKLCLYLASQLNQMYYFANQFRKIDLHNYNLIITFCDSIIPECVFTLIGKNQGVITASLQHGQYTAYRENKFINSGVELRSLVSDYLLSWNQMTIDEVEKVGKIKTEPYLAGILGYIGKQRQLAINPMNKVFGVVINHPSFEEENILLVKSANILASKIGYKYYLKLHPNYDLTHFDSIVCNDYYLGTIKKGVPIIDYANSCEFSVASSSSVFCELVFLKHHVIRYSSGKVDDKFRDVPFGLTFDNPNHIFDVYKKGFNNNDENALFNYLCGTADVTATYRCFLDKYERE